MSAIMTFPLRFKAQSDIFRLTFAWAGLLTVIGTCPARAQDAKTILQNMMNTYRGMNSYEGRASAGRRETLPNGRVLADDSLTITMFYQKPNKLKIDFTMPSGGRTIYYDGATLTFYQSKAQTYETTPVRAPNLAALTDALLRFQVGSRFDTLYFLSGKTVASVAGLTRKPDAIRNGRPVYVVSGHELSQTTRATIVWTWMIDKKTNLIARVEGQLSNIPQRIKLVQGKKSVTKDITVTNVLTQNIIDPKPNATLDNKVFVFSIPPGTTKIAPPSVNKDK